MFLTLKEIHLLEMRWESLEKAAEELQIRLANGQTDVETVTRLGFIAWYLYVESGCIELVQHKSTYSKLFIYLYKKYRKKYEHSPDFCTSFGTGILGWWYFWELEESEGINLLKKASKIDGRYESIQESVLEDLVFAKHFDEFGIYGAYMSDRMKSIQ